MIIISGASGLLGRAVLSTLQSNSYNTIGLAFSRNNNLLKCDLTNHSQLINLFNQFPNVEIFIHCAAERRPDIVENNPTLAKQLNIHTPIQICNLFHSIHPNGLFIYISTDYLYDGTACIDNPNWQGYTEQDQVHPLNQYGITKWLGEVGILTSSGYPIPPSHPDLDHLKQDLLKDIQVVPGKVISIRVPLLYGPVEYPEESGVSMLESIILSAEPKQMDHYQIRAPTNVLDVAKCIMELIKANLDGIFNYSCQEKLTRFEICKEIAKAKGISNKLIPTGEISNPHGTKRPYNASLSIEKINSLISQKILPCSILPEITISKWYSR